MADTHVPKRARDLPPALWAAIDAADVAIHAGDWVDVALLDAIEARAKRLIGVYGNNDGPALRARLPEVAHVELTSDGSNTAAPAVLRLGVVHETGPANGRERRCDAAFAGLDVLIFGHSHIPWDTMTPGGMRLLNPGSPTDRRRQPVATFMTATVVAGALDEVWLHPIAPTAAAGDLAAGGRAAAPDGGGASAPRRRR